MEALHRLDVLGVAFCRVLIFEVFLQNHGGGDGVHGSSGALELFFGVFCVMQNSSGLLFQQTFRFPAGQALVEHVYGQAELLAQACGKACGLLGHIAAGAIEAQRQAHDDLPHAMLARKFAQSPHVFIAIDALESEKRPRKLRLCVGNSQANARAAVIHGQD